MNVFDVAVEGIGRYYIYSNEAVKQAIIPMRFPYGMLGARLLGLSYIEYLTYLENECGAVLSDEKGAGYFFQFYFCDKTLCQAHADDLSERWAYLFGEVGEIEKPKLTLADF